jgi:hypothetical protein
MDLMKHIQQTCVNVSFVGMHLQVIEEETYFYRIRFDSIRSDAIRFDTIRSDSIRSDPILSDPIRFDPILSYTIRSDPIRSDPILSDPIRSDPIWSDLILYYPIRSVPILPDPIRSDLIRYRMAWWKNIVNEKRKYFLECVVHGPFGYVSTQFSLKPTPTQTV